MPKPPYNEGMNPWLIKLAAAAAIRLAKRGAFTAATRRFGKGKTTAAFAAAAVAERLVRRRRGK